MGLAVTTEHSKLSNTRPIGMAADCCINSSVAPSVGLHAIFWWNCRCSTTRVSNEAPPRRPHHPVRHSSHSVTEEIADRIPQCVLGCYIGMYVDTYLPNPSKLQEQTWRISILQFLCTKCPSFVLRRCSVVASVAVTTECIFSTPCPVQLTRHRKNNNK